MCASTPGWLLFLVLSRQTGLHRTLSALVATPKGPKDRTSIAYLKLALPEETHAPTADACEGRDSGSRDWAVHPCGGHEWILQASGHTTDQEAGCQRKQAY